MLLNIRLLWLSYLQLQIDPFLFTPPRSAVQILYYMYMYFTTTVCILFLFTYKYIWESLREKGPSVYYKKV